MQEQQPLAPQPLGPQMVVVADPALRRARFLRAVLTVAWVLAAVFAVSAITITSWYEKDADIVEEVVQGGRPVNVTVGTESVKFGLFRTCVDVEVRKDFRHLLNSTSDCADVRRVCKSEDEAFVSHGSYACSATTANTVLMFVAVAAGLAAGALSSVRRHDSRARVAAATGFTAVGVVYVAVLSVGAQIKHLALPGYHYGVAYGLVLCALFAVLIAAAALLTLVGVEDLESDLSAPFIAVPGRGYTGMPAVSGPYFGDGVAGGAGAAGPQPAAGGGGYQEPGGKPQRFYYAASADQPPPPAHYT